nr:MAG TPA: FERM-like protein [Caudoviricetes sp.]
MTVSNTGFMTLKTKDMSKIPKTLCLGICPTG